MGDVVHALPAVAALRQRFPDCFIGWAVEPRWSPLLETRDYAEDATRGPQKPIVDLVHSVPVKLWKRQPFSLDTLRSILALREELREARYDLCVDLQGTIRSAVIGRLAGAARFVGPESPRERQAAWLYGQRVPVRSAHVIDQWCEVLGAAIGEVLTPAPIQLPVEEQAEDWAEAMLTSLGIWKEDQFVVIAPSAGWGAKVWPAERYNEVAKALHGAGYRVLVTTVDRDRTSETVAGNGVATVVCCNLAFLTSLLRRAGLAIGGDTGPIHIAASLGRPVLALFGPTDPARNGPSGVKCQVLRDAGSITDHRRHEATEAGLMLIAADEVIKMALQQLQEPSNEIDA